ncbi:calcium-binding protein [Roseobacter fucihabitans]|nr:calcium-binding protein [Roseobacter litoralis]
MAYGTELAQANNALGNSNPTLAYNLDHFKDYAPVQQFLDVAKSMRPWWGDMKGGGESFSYDEFKNGGYLDENGWVKEIPEGVSNVVGFWQWSSRSELDLAEDVRGVYVLEYEGKGDVVMTGDARIISNEPGRIVYENMNGSNVFMRIHSTDPDGTGDYIRDVTVVAEKNLPLYEAGAVYNPAWLELIEDARELRFVGWMETSNATLTSWQERSSPEGMFWDAGVPVEYMVKLANELGADPWFTMPHTADEEYIRNFATYVRDNLDPELKAKVEYSNEAWNWAFQQTRWLYDKSEDEWGTPAHNDYYVKKSVETALIWEDIFGSEADARLINVLGSQTVNTWMTERMLNAETWKVNEPENYVDPATVFEELAITTYFGNATVGDANLRKELIAAIKDPDVDATAYLADKLMDPSYDSSIPQIANFLAQNAALAEKYGLKLSAYEGGQHVHHAFAIRDLTHEDINILQDFMIDFVRSEEMGQLYRELWDVWAEIGDGPFMQHGDIASPNKYGSWALYAGLEDSTPRSEALEELNRDTTEWWADDRDGSQFQQGLVNDGSQNADLLIGTNKNDYLLGMAGDDILVAGEGNDGLNGGDGLDRAVFAGAFSDYTVRAEGDGYRVEGPDGSDFLINIEELAFANEQLVILSELVESGDGTLVLASVVDPAPGPDPKPAVFTPGKLAGGQIKNGADHDTVAIDDLSGNNGGIIIKTIWASSTIAQNLDLGTPKETPSYLSYSKNVYEFSELVQLVSNSLYKIGQTDFNMHDAAIVTQAVKIVATSGDDSFFGGLANDFASGGAGNDHMIGGFGDDTLYGDEGDDRLIGQMGNDSIYGEDGNDHIHGGIGSDYIEGGVGNDYIYAGEGDDTAYGGRGNDWMSGESGNDQLFGGLGDDTMHGGLGNDMMIGESGNDTLYGNEGDDRLFGHAGNDTFFGGNGNDAIDGGSGNDVIHGNLGNDRLIADEGDDVVYGGQGNDILAGGVGNDILAGGVGNDILVGGAGKDQFVFDIGDGDDQINDFAQEDSLDLTAFFSAGQTLEDAASMENGNLVLSNGDDRITLLGLDTEDLSWMNIEM